LSRPHHDQDEEDYPPEEGTPRQGRGWFGRIFRILGGTLLLAGLAGMVALVLYVIPLDRTVREKFEGKRWALPARVYARPLELYTGAPRSWWRN